MAIALEDKVNVTPPGGDFPYGDIKDNTGSNNGTPVNRNTYGDFHQFFARLLDLAGIVANGLPENGANTFQYITALIGVIISQATTLVNSEAITRAAADTTLQNNINTETSARTTADNLKANKAQGAWSNIALASGWSVAFGLTPQYLIDQFGFVHLRGAMAVNAGSFKAVNAGGLPSMRTNATGVKVVPYAAHGGGAFLGYCQLEVGDDGSMFVNKSPAWSNSAAIDVLVQLDGFSYNQGV